MNNTECNHVLTKIASKYKAYTDKCPMSEYNIQHVYTEIYGPLFEHLRYEPVRLLEVGVRWGGSLAMWRDFFPNAVIYGVDINLSQMVGELKSVNVIEGNAYDEDFAKKHFENTEFDIMIDDGTHAEKDIIKYFNIYRKYLKKGGYLIAEDIATIELARNVIDNFNGPINNMSIIDRAHCIPSTRGERMIMYKGC